MSIKLKVYELAKELSVDSHQLVEVVQRLGIEIKNTMSVLGTEEVKLVREHYRKNRPAGKGGSVSVPGKSNVTEKRVGTTVIRRRAAKTVEETAPAPEPVALETVEEAANVELSVESPAEVEAEVGIETEAVAEVETVETEQAPIVAATPIEPIKPAPVVPKMPVIQEIVPIKRRSYPSIIKKVATEQFLTEKVGPKVDKPKKEIKTIIPGDKSKSGITTTTATATAGTGLKRVKEIDFTSAATEAAKEAGKKKLLDRQNTVFKSSDYLKREMVHSTKKKKAAITRPALKTQITVPSDHKRVVEMGATTTPAEMAKQMGQKASAVIAKLMNLGATVTINQSVDLDTATLVCHEFGFELKQNVFKEESYIPTVDVSPEKLSPRGPVVTIMGHVDHGKTSLLDAIRKTKVAAGEAGGITQHVGAYTVKLPKGKITFVDTPGHEAFTAMRARGAKVTDLVILVVSAVDGVMPQTLESVNHAKAASVPIIVAVNKIDLPDANPDRIKQTLAGHGLNPEEWGGETQYVSVSAKTGKGIDQLLEGILLQSEMMELKANYDMPARGVVIESRLDKNRGPIASVLVQQGKLKSGDIIVSGVSFGKVRAMTASDGSKLNEALPSDPVEILGLPAVPAVGDDVFVVEDEKTAKALTSSRLDKQRSMTLETKPKMTLEEMMNAAPGTEKELRVILKSDVAGSGEALKEALSKFPTDKVRVKILHTGTGGITESDVMLASASQAAILGFNIRPDVKAQRLAEIEGVTVRTYTIIYDLLEDIKKLAEGLLSAEIREKVIGRAEVRSVFNIPKIGAIAGSAVIDGKVVRGCYLRLLRDNRVVYEGKISSLRRFKEDVKEVASGFECGIGVENFNDLKLGDQFEAFLKEEHKTTL